MDGDEPDDEGGYEGPGRENCAEAGSWVPAADGCDGGEDVWGAIAEGEEGDGAGAGGEAEVGGELGDDDGEVVLGGADEEEEVEEEDEGEGGDGEKWVLLEEAEMEGGVVEEAVGVAMAVGEGEGAAFLGGSFMDGGAGGGGGGIGGGLEEESVERGLRRGFWGGRGEEEEDERGEDGEGDCRGFEEGEGHVPCIKIQTLCSSRNGMKTEECVIWVLGVG